MYQHNGFVEENFGTNIYGFMAVMALEGGVYVHDALVRERKTKKSSWA